MLTASLCTTQTEWDAENKSGTPDVEKIVSPLTSGPIQNVHVKFSESPKPCLEAPVVEVVVSKMKPGQDLVAFGPICDDTLRITMEQPGCLGIAWGYTEEDPKDVILIVGWESVEVQHCFIIIV
jgi:hypothetical protein